MNIQKLIENYLDTEAYGCNLIIKEYCHFPKILPLPCHMEHGWTPISHALVSDLEIAQKKELMMVYSKRRERAWKDVSRIPVMIMGSPFILYRNMKKIELDPEAKGTIAFPSHSTIFLKSRYNIDDYCLSLKKIPEKFQPITVCLLYPDIKMGRDKIYKKHGFEVVSAGKILRGSLNFVENYYKLLAKHKFATSNEIGSYTFYSVEMGIPFFLSGEEPSVINVDNKDPNIGKQAKTSDFEQGKKANKLFGTGPITKITTDQKRYVLDELGLGDCVSPEKMRASLFKNTKKLSYWVSRLPMYYLLSLIKKIVPNELSYWVHKKTSKK